MEGGRERFIRQMEDIADDIGSVPLSDLAVLLRRAALRLRNDKGDMALEPDMEQAIATLADALGKPKGETIRMVLRDWLTANGYLPPSHELHENTEPDGVA